jgi:hypothetical protein
MAWRDFLPGMGRQAPQAAPHEIPDDRGNKQEKRRIAMNEEQKKVLEQLKRLKQRAQTGHRLAQHLELGRQSIEKKLLVPCSQCKKLFDIEERALYGICENCRKPRQNRLVDCMFWVALLGITALGGLLVMLYAISQLSA